MKIACQSCQAKYTIADEKVVGKIVKIRCKKCGATIVINGNDPEATNPLPAGEGGSEWTVNVAEGDQRTMTSDEIVEGYHQGIVTDETYCWKDGMADWLPLREIDELYQAASSGGNGPTQVQGGADFAPLSVRGFDDQATQPLQRENMGGVFSGMSSGGNGHAEANGNGASLFGGGAAAAAPAAPASQPPPAAARRAGGRAGGADLFGSAAAAGGEEDVMTSAPHGAQAAAAEEPGKLTGQRNENSVLFSLSALTSNSPKVEKDKPAADGSGLIDIRALSSTMQADTGKKKEHVDDIMNLGGGGAFSAPLAAPILAPPIASADLTDGGTPVKDKQKTMLIALIGGGFLLLLVVIVVLIVKLTSGPKLDEAAAGAGSGSAAPMGSMAAAPTDTTTAQAANSGNSGGSGALPPGTGAVAQNNTPSHASGGGGGGGGGHTTSHSGGGGGDTASGGGSGASAGGGGGGGGGGGTPDLLSAMNAATPGSHATGGGGGGGGGGASAPFDRGAAAGTLGSIASSLGSCKKGDGPTGSGHVKVTFSPSGNVKAVDVDQAPFAGTSVGGCVAGKFRSAHVPPFSGSEITVGKSFTIN